MVTEFSISKTEIERRIKAFTTLVVSLIVGLVLSFSFTNLEFWIPAVFVAVFLSTLVVFRMLIIKFFRTYLKTEVYLDEEAVKRITSRFTEIVEFKDILRINVLRTSRGDIRELSIITRKGRRIGFNAIANFEEFRTKLIHTCDDKIRYKESHEPIDYDHPAFYLVLGLLLSCFISILGSIVVNADEGTIKYFYLGISIYLFGVGLYTIITRPLSKNYGNKSVLLDISLSGLMVASGVLIYFIA